MKDYVLTCCSTSDMPAAFFKEKDIPYVCFHFLMDGETYPDDLGKSIPFEDFYNKMSAGSEPKTSQVNFDEYMNFFEPFLKQGKDIIHVSLSSGISGSYNSAQMARLELFKKYPDRKIEIVDSRGASSGYGLFMDMLAEKRDSGASYEELLEWAEENRLFVHHWFFSTDLTFYIKGGRISRAAGLFGTILKICPLLNMDASGHLVPREKIRTKKKVIKEIVQKMVEHARNGINYSGRCYISHSACLQDARDAADLIESTFTNLKGKVKINSIGTAIGSHTGPGTVALFFVGDLRC